MRRNSIKIMVLVLIILGTLSWLAVEGYKEGKTYYMTVDEYFAVKDRFHGKNIRVAGNVTGDSIQRSSSGLEFILEYNHSTMTVFYVGRSPVPDTFKGGTQAVVEGSMSKDSIFHAHKIQAKCASKYESEFSVKGS